MQPNRQWLNKAALAGGAALVLMVVSFGSYRAGRGSVPPPEPAKAVCPSPQDAASVERRNLVWRALNMDETLPESPEKIMGAVVGLMINPQIPPENRRLGMETYAWKSVRYFSAEELKEIEGMLNSEESLQRAEALRRIVGFDREAAELVHQVLADKARIGLLAEGKPIPLEEVPMSSGGTDSNQAPPADSP